MAIWTAVIWFIVRVPVLSELSAEVDPRVSTERSCFTMAPAAASIWEPLDRMAVSIAGSAVGMAAIMNATAVRNSSWSGTPRAMPRSSDAASAKAARIEDLARQPVDLLRQRRLLGRGRLEHPADVADLRVHAGRDDEDRAGTAGDLGVHERHVHAVPERGVGSDRVHLLGGGHALTRQRGLVDLEGRGREDAGVRGDEVARLEVDDVARDELVHGDIDEVAVPAGPRRDDERLAEGISGR